jgi:hypothetical protein
MEGMTGGGGELDLADSGMAVSKGQRRLTGRIQLAPLAICSSTLRTFGGLPWIWVTLPIGQQFFGRKFS